MSESRRSVGIITHSGYPYEVRARRMAEALVKHGCAVDLLCVHLPDRAEPDEELVNGVRVTRLPVTHVQGGGARAYLGEYARFFRLAAAELFSRHRRQPYALLQVHNPPDPLIFCTLPARLRLPGRRPVPLIFDLREFAPELFMSRFGLAPGSIAVRWLLAFERWGCAYADAVLVLHERHRRTVITRGVPPGKLTEVMNCPDERLFDPAAFPPRPRERDGRFVIVYNGGIYQRYGVDLLVRAVAQVRLQAPEVRLEVYGLGDHAPAIAQLVAEQNLADNVRLHGHQPIERMPAAIAAADVGVVPMRQDIFTDCVMPTKLLEYITLGTPAIAARTATVTDYFDETMVQLFQPGDVAGLAECLLATYRDPAAAQARATQALRFTETHNWRRGQAVYLDVADRLMGGKS